MFKIMTISMANSDEKWRLFLCCSIPRLTEMTLSGILEFTLWLLCRQRDENGDKNAVEMQEGRRMKNYWKLRVELRKVFWFPDAFILNEMNV